MPAPQVLIVDDDPAILRLLAKWLEAAGYAVRQAADGARALEAIQRECPDFLITDWEMPEMDGPELCRLVRGLTLPHYLYAIFLTQRTDSRDVIAGLESGADDFLSKPVQRGELMARLRSGQRVLELERRLSELAKTDLLSGLPTKRALDERFTAEWARSRRYHLPLSCVMCDIDYFKRVNDTLGHPAGDRVIKAIGAVLAESCRGSDFVARYGGEEFCALLPETSEAQAAQWADRLRERIAGLRLAIDGKPVPITCSFGVAQRLDDLATPDELLDLADQALLVSKQSGRNRVTTFSSLAEQADVNLAAAAGHGGLFSGVRARQVMTTLVSCLREDEPIGRAAEFFLEHQVNAAPVVNGQGKLCGVLSEKDLLGVMLWPESWQQPVRSVMKANVVCYDEDTPVVAIYDFLCRVSIRRVVIVKDAVPTGVISRAQILQWFANWLRTRDQCSPALAECPQQPCPTRGNLTDIASALVRQSGELHRGLLAPDEHLAHLVVSNATKIQELTTELLSHLRQATWAAMAVDEWSSADDPAADEILPWFPPDCTPDVLTGNSG